MTVDGAGNIYVADYYSDDVIELIPSGSGYTQQVVESGMGPTLSVRWMV